jgi:hypothetical protein
MWRNPAAGAVARWPYLLLLLLPMLNACGNTSTLEVEAARAALDSQRATLGALGQPLPAPALPERALAARSTTVPGAVTELLGAAPDVLLARLGTPQLRRPEGDAEVWLYSGGGCQLDLLLYPAPGGLRVMHAQARAGGIGQRTEAACLRDIAVRAPPS